MASGADGNGLDASPPKSETGRVRTELLEDLSGKLQVLQERMELCDKILKDLVTLRDTAAKSSQKDAAFKDAKLC